MKKLFSWLKMWLLAIGGCFSAKLETMYLMGDKELMRRIQDCKDGKAEFLSYDEFMEQWNKE